MLRLRQLDSSVEFSYFLLDFLRKLNVSHCNVSGINLELEVSALTKNLRHKNGQITENNSINNSTSQVNSNDVNILDLSLGTQLISTNNKNHVINTYDVTSPHITFRKSITSSIIIQIFITEEVRLSIIPEIIRRNPLNNSAVVRVITWNSERTT